MPDYMVFRTVVPPGFNLRKYADHNSEPIRFDPVTVVEADDPRSAVNAVIAATGQVGAGFFAIEGTMVDFNTSSRLGKGGKLSALDEDRAELSSGENE